MCSNPRRLSSVKDVEEAEHSKAIFSSILKIHKLWAAVWGSLKGIRSAKV
jgi:hypothetical protein